MVPFWVLSIVRHLVFRDPKGDHSVDNHPYRDQEQTQGGAYEATVVPKRLLMPSWSLIVPINLG